MTRAASMQVGTSAPGRAEITNGPCAPTTGGEAPIITFLLLSDLGALRAGPHGQPGAYFADKDHYLSPFNSPCVTAQLQPGARDFGTWFGHFPPFIPFAIVTLPFLLGFRLTCYYYRRTYYRAFWESPPACAVAEPHAKYTGETRFPLIFQNLHRYFWLAAGVISLVNTWDVVQAFRPQGQRSASASARSSCWSTCLLWAYTLSCHSCRHIVGGRLRSFSGHPLRYRPGRSSRSSTPSTCSWPGHARHADDHRRLHRAGGAGTFSDLRIIN